MKCRLQRKQEKLLMIQKRGLALSLSAWPPGLAHLPFHSSSCTRFSRLFSSFSAFFGGRTRIVRKCRKALIVSLSHCVYGHFEGFLIFRNLEYTMAKIVAICGVCYLSSAR